MFHVYGGGTATAVARKKVGFVIGDLENLKFEGASCKNL